VILIKTKALPSDLIVSHFRYGCYTVIVLEKKLYLVISVDTEKIWAQKHNWLRQ